MLRAYIGGSFTSVNGTAAKNLAAVNTSTGSVVKAFGHNASGAVQTILALSHHVLVGGNYKSINGSTANPYMTGLNPTTGKDDGFAHLKITVTINSRAWASTRPRSTTRRLATVAPWTW